MMRWISRPVLSLLFSLSLVAGCKQGDLEPDASAVPVDDAATTQVDVKLVKKDKGAPDTAAGATTVAAIQYANGQAATVKAECTSAKKPNACALEELTRQARSQGASLVVFPEAYELQLVEPEPALGDNPGTDEKYATTIGLKTFSALAHELGITLVIDIFTKVGTDQYNTQVAFDPTGAVVGLHHKFNLFGNEPNFLKAGSDVSAFDTPLGTVGMLICADIYGSSALISQLVNTLKARIVVVSSEWSAGNPIPSYFAPFAKKWGVYVVVGNVTNAQEGYGGCIVDPQGTIIAQVRQPSPSVLVGTIPLP